MHTEPMVSLIIPAYNVEKYINQCVNSVLNQSYANLEVIAVNDGSTDGTLVILHALEKQDTRVKVIDKKNEGVSAARNLGIEMARGEYIVFVDADDYLAEDYVEYMLSLANHTGADFCLSENCYTRNGEQQVESETVTTMSAEDATALLLSPRVIVGCWNKIYKKNFLEKNMMRFSTTLFYGEGLSFITTAAQNSSIVGVGNRKVYYYRRNNEVSATSKFNIEKMYNGEKALNLIGEKLDKRNQKVIDMLILHKSLFALGALTRLRANGVTKQYKDDDKHWLHMLRGNVSSVISSKHISLYRKMMILGGCFFPSLMMKLDQIRRRRIVGQSV